ncbi:MAG: flagellar basal body rod protein FlgC [Candidatus Sericytochromatia bacterium]|jgi:flagellar basal-body rod protein FlgC
MTLFNALAVSATGMTSNRLWIDLIANNIANVNSIKPNGDPYQRKLPIFSEMVKELDSEVESQMADFDFGKDPVKEIGAGVQTYKVLADNAPFKFVYEPGNPYADKNGFVKKSNVEVINEMVDMIAANRAYDASVQIANAAKAMVNKALEIGK